MAHLEGRPGIIRFFQKLSEEKPTLYHDWFAACYKAGKDPEPLADSMAEQVEEVALRFITEPGVDGQARTRGVGNA